MLSRPGARRRLAADAVLLLAVVGLLAACQFLLPPPVRSALYFRHDLTEPWTLLTAAYVHADAGHLARNVLGYFLAAAYACALCAGAGERRWFRRTLAAFLLVLPVLVDLTSYAVFAAGYPSIDLSSKGFSGVVGGFAGFLLVALYAYVRERRSARAGVAVCVSLLLLCLFSVDVRYAGGVRPQMAVLVAAGVVLAGGLTAVESRDTVGSGGRLPDRTRRRTAGEDAAVIALVGAVLGVSMFGLFPDPDAVVRDGVVTNVFAHAAGFFLGIALSAVTLAAERRGEERSG